MTISCIVQQRLLSIQDLSHVALLHGNSSRFLWVFFSSCSVSTFLGILEIFLEILFLFTQPVGLAKINFLRSEKFQFVFCGCFRN